MTTTPARPRAGRGGDDQEFAAAADARTVLTRRDERVVHDDAAIVVTG